MARRQTTKAAGTEPDIRGAARVTHGAGPVESPETPPTTHEPMPAKTPETPTSPPDLTTPPVQAAEPPRRSGGVGFLGTVLGGMIAAAIGFGLALFLYPDGMPGVAAVPEDDAPVAQLDGDSDRLDELALQLEALGSRIDEASSPDTAAGDIEQMARTSATAIEEIDSRLNDLSGQVDALSSSAPADPSDRLAEISDTLAALTQRVEGLEARPAPSEDPDARAAMAQRLEEFRTELDQAVTDARDQMQAAQTETQDALAEAQASARRAETQTALTRVEAALATGEPYQDALNALSQTAEVPEALSAPAADGVPTLESLRQSYADAARAALAASPQDVPEGQGFGGRLQSFLRTQTNARSLSPQEGDGTDAILSRAEAELNVGNLSAALTELDALPDEARAAMNDWMARARTRADALAAADELSATIDGS